MAFELDYIKYESRRTRMCSGNAQPVLPIYPSYSFWNVCVSRLHPQYSP